jgi:hypothetical protein
MKIFCGLAQEHARPARTPAHRTLRARTRAVHRETAYQFRYERSYLTHYEKGEVIHLSGIYLSLSRNFSISTGIDLRSGQTVIVGKTSFAVGNTGLIAAITAKIVD